MTGKRGRSKTRKSTPTKKKTNKNSNHNEDEDAMSESTKITENNAPVSHNYATFLLLRAKVQSSKKATETLRLKLGKILTTLQESDESVNFSKFHLDSSKKNPFLQMLHQLYYLHHKFQLQSLE